MDGEKTLLFPKEKIKNYPLYFLRIISKLISLSIFGVGSVLLSIICFPIAKLIFPKKQKFQYHMRHLIYVLFKFFLGIMWSLNLLKIKVNKKNYLDNLKSAIIVANHPGYLDSVVMLSMLKHGSIVPKASLSKGSVMQVIIKELYMPNSIPFDDMVELAKGDLEAGNCIMIFPEGTRSTPYGQHVYKKGAARLSLRANVPIIPVYIGGTEKRGLGKGDKILQVNPNHRYVYDLQIKDPIYPQEFADVPETIAAKRITEKMKAALSDEANAMYRYTYSNTNTYSNT